MLPLRDVQAGLARAIRSGGPLGGGLGVCEDGIAAEARLAVYRSHFRITLADALAATYPVVRRLVGTDFFAAAARRFIADEPPRSPCLFEYGGGFPDWLGRLPEAAGLPWLTDVARLEWALAEAEHADDVASLDAAVLAALPAERLAAAALRLHPSVRLVISRYPVDRIWRANQDDAGEEAVDLDEGGVRLLVHRRDGDVGWLALAASDTPMVEAILRGAPLPAAAEAAGADAGRLAQLLVALIEGGLISGIELPDREETK